MVDYVRALLAKKETTYGTDAVPTGAANGILTRNFQAKPIEVDKLERKLDTGTWGAQPSAATNERQTMTFEMELGGSGAAGTAAPWMEVLQGCGLAAPTITAATKAEQKFALYTDVPGALSTRHYVGDQMRKGVGARGTFSLDFTANAYPFVNVSLTALIPTATPFSVAAPGAIDLTRWKQPVEINSVNTVFMLDGYAALLRSLKLDANVGVNVRSLVGGRYVNRGPHAMTGSIVIEAPSQATKDYIATLRANTLVVLQMVHGTVAGAIVQLDAPKVQITEISESEEDGKLMWTLAVSITVGAGGDDIIITAK